MILSPEIAFFHSLHTKPVMFLFSDDAGFITGQSMPVDGGLVFI